MKRIVFILCATWMSLANAQSILPGNGTVIAQKNVTLVYNVATGQPDMVIIDANNLSDPAWNPPGTKQVNIPLAVYNQMPDAPTFQTYMSTAITADIGAQAMSGQ